MALLFAESFSETSIAYKWTSAGNITSGLSSTTYARRSGSNSLYIELTSTVGYYGPYISFPSNYTGGVVGTAFKLNFPSNGTFTSFPTVFAIQDSTTSQLKVRIDVNNNVYLYRNTTLLATGSTKFSFNTWHYLELKFLINSGTSGTYELRLDGVNIASSSGANTSASGNAYWNRFLLGIHEVADYGGVCRLAFDDVYVCNSTAPNNDFLGDQRIDNVSPSAAGYQTDFTPSTGANYACVDELPSSDTDYVYSSTLDHIDSYIIGDLPNETPALGTINAVYQNIVAKRTSVGTAAQITPFVRISGTNYYGSAISLIDSYKSYIYVWNVNPATTSTWLYSDIDNAEFGYKLTSV